MASSADKVEVGVRVGVGVNVMLLIKVMTSCGAWLPWREEKLMPSVLSATSTKLKVPSAFTNEVTLYSTQVFVLILPLLSTAPLVRAGRLFHVIPVSVQDEPVAYTAGPFAEPLVVTNIRSRALWIVPDIPVMVKRI